MELPNDRSAAVTHSLDGSLRKETHDMPDEGVSAGKDTVEYNR